MCWDVLAEADAVACDLAHIHAYFRPISPPVTIRLRLVPYLRGCEKLLFGWVL